MTTEANSTGILTFRSEIKLYLGTMGATTDGGFTSLGFVWMKLLLFVCAIDQVEICRDNVEFVAMVAKLLG